MYIFTIMYITSQYDTSNLSNFLINSLHGQFCVLLKSNCFAFFLNVSTRFVQQTSSFAQINNFHLQRLLSKMAIIFCWKI